jgi:hypothetical protein
MSALSRISRSVLSEIRPLKSDGFAVGASRHLRHQLLHDAAHVRGGFPPDGQDGLPHQGFDLGVRERLRQVLLEDDDFRRLLLGKIGPASLIVEVDRLLPLLDHRGKHLEDSVFPDLPPRLDLLVLDRGQAHPQSRKGQGVPLLGRLLHILLDTFLEPHPSLAQFLHFLQRALPGRESLFLFFHARFLVMLPLADFGKNPGFLALLLEPF